MAKRSMKEKVKEVGYNRPSLDKKAMKLKKSFDEVYSIVNGKKK